MTERKETRLKKEIRVKLKDDTGTYNGIVTTLSKTGMSVKTDHVFPTYKIIDVLVKIGEKMVQFRGSVRWVHDYPNDADTDPEGRLNLVGLSLHKPPPEYLKHFE